MVGKHYRWQQRWTLNREQATARHENGLTVRFVLQGSNAPGSTIGACWTPDERQWFVVTDLEALNSLFADLTVQHGPNATQMIARLGREAGELWADAHRHDH